MKRFIFGTVALWLGLASLSASAAAPPEGDPKKTSGPLILVVVDALRPDHLGAYGYPRNTSPHLDALAHEGVTFTHFFANANWTRPQMATLLTGLPPDEHRVQAQDDRLSVKIQTVGEALQQKGVPTGAVIGNGNAGQAFGLQRGFDMYADTVKHWKGLPNAQQVVDLAKPFVRQHRSEPFFLVLFLVDTHDPYHAPAPFESMFAADGNVPIVRSPHWEDRRYTQAQRERITATYDGAIRYTDHVLGSFFGFLKQQGIYDKSTILVTADHGEAFGEHGVYLHSHHLYDEIVRVPMVARWPQMSERGSKNDVMAQSLDVAPTIVQHFGAQFTQAPPGEDLEALVRAPAGPRRERPVLTVFNNFGIHRRSLRTRHNKLIYWDKVNRAEFTRTVGAQRLLPSVSFEQARWFAFDLAVDPQERHDKFNPRLWQQSPWSSMARRLQATTPKAPAPPPQTLGNVDPETLRDLRALGYVQ